MSWFPTSLLALFPGCLHGIPPLFLLIGIVTVVISVFRASPAVRFGDTPGN